MTPQRMAGLLLNLALRVMIVYFLWEVWMFQDDPRFAGKAIPLRNLIIVGGCSLLFPILHFGWWKKRGHRFPFWQDSLYLSVFWLDMAGNSLNLYDSYYYFDLLPHFHGTGAVAVVLMAAFRLSFLCAAAVSNLIHMGLEVQEYYTDVLAGTHNVRGISDTVNDLAVGMLGALLYTTLVVVIRRTARREAAER